MNYYRLLLAAFFAFSTIASVQAQDLTLLSVSWDSPCEQKIDDTRYMDCSLDSEGVSFSLNEQQTEGFILSGTEKVAKFEITTTGDSALSFNSQYIMLNGVIHSLSDEKLVIQNVELNKNYIYMRRF